MTTLFQKASDLIGGNLHALLDAAIDLNSIPVCQQQCRRLADAKLKIMNAAAAARADVGIAQGEVEHTQHQIDQNTSDAQLLLDDGDPSNDGDAQKLMEQVVELQAGLADKTAALAQAKATADGLKTAADAVSAKYTALVANISKLEAADRSAKAKSASASVLRDANALIGEGGSVNVDNIANRIKRADAVADEQLKDALTATSAAASPMASVTTSKAAALIAQMKAKKAAATS